MQAKTSADIELNSVINAMIRAQTTQEVWDAYADTVTALGFTRLLYACTRNLPRDGEIPDPDTATFFFRGEKAFVDAYVKDKLYLHSPFNMWGAENTGFTSWAKAIQQYSDRLTPGFARLLQLNAEHQMFAGYVGSLNDTVRGFHGIIGLSPDGSLNEAQTDALWAHSGPQIETLTHLLHLRVASLPLEYAARKGLTRRQREALRWYAQGKTMLDIAAILDVSPATVDKHLRKSREALDATTTAHAVQIATSLNLLDSERS